MEKLHYKVITVVLGLFLILPSLVHSQQITPYTIEDAQTVSELIITPTHPSIGDTMVVELSSFAIDLNNSLVAFYKNDVLLKKDFGVRKVGYGEIRDITRIKVIIETPDGTIVEKTKTVIPGSVNILWEARSYTPPFYKGKALYTKESSLVLTAIPTMKNSSGRLISSEDIVYTWKINGKNQTTSNGLGRNTILVEEIFLGSDLNVEVLAKSKDAEVYARQRETITSSEPDLYFYENDPLYGINWSHSLDTVLVEKEISIISIPFFFSTKNPAELLYSWTANSKPLTENSNAITLRNEDGLQGIVRLNLSVENIESFFEGARESLNLQFN